MSPHTRDSLAAHLLDEILAGRLASGARLPPERTLARTFGLSRPMVREVLRGLAERGFVDIVPSRGTFVREPRSTDGARSLDTSYRRRNTSVRELLETRMMVEAYSARLAACHATDTEIRAMRRCLDDFATTRRVLERARLDLAFHALVVRAGHNTVIETMYASITSLTFELMLRSLSDRQARQASISQHDEVWQAIRDRDPDRAYAAMREHLDLTRQLYAKDLERRVDQLALRELQRMLGPSVTLEGILDDVARRHAAFQNAPGVADELS
ncbi:FadR/GntR family transcriptional regulator [Actinopolymorpha alba]|uniref:FadR/GntR family transcriptional regulator n=1 Tax=Actinopolymorpha alba TaxID=533267 RepID=UPI000363CBFF|nr:FCD domain-containing protein [Actinopolymorpha alba]